MLAVMRSRIGTPPGEIIPASARSEAQKLSLVATDHLIHINGGGARSVAKKSRTAPEAISAKHNNVIDLD